MECQICFNMYDSQRRSFAGTCGHSLCLECVKSLRESHCPQCRKSGAFANPLPNFLAIDLQTQINAMELAREQIIPELDKLQQENTVLKQNSEALVETLERNGQVIEHYKNEHERIKKDCDALKLKNEQLVFDLQGFLRREEEFLRKQNDWDMLEDCEIVPSPENIIMKIPPKHIISDATKKRLTDLGIVIIHRVDLASRQLLVTAKSQLNEKVVPAVKELAVKTGLLTYD